MISLSQIRAARALLDWTQNDLAQRSGLSLRALNSIERGLAVPRIDTLRFIQETFEKENIEFGENDGVRRKTERLDIVKWEGAEYLNQHLIDVVRELNAPGSEVLYNLASEEIHADLRPQVLDDYFSHIAKYRITERVLLATGEKWIISPPPCYRWMKPENFNHVCYIVYGDNVAFQILSKPHRVIIIRNPGIADMFRRQFDFNWASAETPWFAKRFKMTKSDEPWSVAKAAEAREWIGPIRHGVSAPIASRRSWRNTRPMAAWCRKLPPAHIWNISTG
jgi:transcriptional regulator with XRE-family HTH domain